MPPKKKDKLSGAGATRARGLSELAGQIKDNIDAPVEVEVDVEEIEGVNTDRLIPTGITLLDLACSGTTVGGLSMGKINTFPGGSSSGKSFIATHIMAKIANTPKFDDYDLIEDDVEQSYEFDTAKLFGQKLVNRMKPPKVAKDGFPIYSRTIQEFKNNILSAVDKGTPFIWTLDSLDALSSDEEMEKEYKEAIKAAKNEDHVKELKGAYHTEKAKVTGQVLRMIVGKLKETNSVLNIIQQTRANLNAGLFGRKEITSGGMAPFFYSSVSAWISKVKTHKDSKFGWEVGQRTKIDVRKNKLTGNKRQIEIDIYNSAGIDNVGSQIDFLVDNKFWVKKGQTIDCVGLDIEGTNKKVHEFIIKNKLQGELAAIVCTAWNEIEESIKIERLNDFE